LRSGCSTIRVYHIYIGNRWRYGVHAAAGVTD
jgi:hypothetical protein